MTTNDAIRGTWQGKNSRACTVRSPCCLALAACQVGTPSGGYGGMSLSNRSPSGDLMCCGFTGPMGDVVSLRPIEEVDLDRLLRFFTEPGLAGEFQRFGFQIQHGLGDAPALRGGPPLWRGFLPGLRIGGWHLRRLGNWRLVGRHDNYEIGIALFPETS